VSAPREPRENARAYYRIETRLPVRCRRATAADVAAFEQRTRLGGENPLDELPPALAIWLRHVEHKLDKLLSLLDASVPPPLDPRDARTVVISGGGLRLDHPAGDAEPGDPFVVELLLPGDPPRPVTALAEMVGLHTDPSEPRRPLLGLRFRYIDEADRDAIVRMVNRAQITERRVARAIGLEP
jgi:hypothetical protein